MENIIYILPEIFRNPEGKQGRRNKLAFLYGMDSLPGYPQTHCQILLRHLVVLKSQLPDIVAKFHLM